MPHRGYLSKRSPSEDEGVPFGMGVNKDDFVVLLDENGEIMSSPRLSQSLKAQLENGRDVIIVIGGAFGHFAPEVKARANLIWSLSKLVFPHQICRLIVTEQIYRAQEIYLGHAYHHE